MSVYKETLHPYLLEHNLNQIVDDNASPGNNETEVIIVQRYHLCGGDS